MTSPTSIDRRRINTRSDTPLTQQLARQLTWLIASGRLQPGDMLPSVRQLAGRLAISVNTVRSAYRKLEANGLVETRHGDGTRVRTHDALLLAAIAGAERSHTAGVILPSLANPFYHAVLEGIEEVAHGDHTMLFVTNSHDDLREAWRYYAQLSAKHVDGIIAVSHDPSAFLGPDGGPPDSAAPLLPIVSVNWPDAAGYAVTMDSASAGYQGTQHLLAHGHRRVGLITWEREIPNVRLANAGYHRALREAGIAADPALVARVPAISMAAGRAGAHQLLRLAQPPTAIFTIADTLALGAISALKDAALRIPEDMAVVGFNDISPAALMHPALTTVHAPAHEMGAEAMRMLGDLIDGRQPDRRRVVLPTALVVRQSCGAHG
jgi:DNA-binding LacI/PurR family transcriptional regulator